MRSLDKARTVAIVPGFLGFMNKSFSNQAGLALTAPNPLSKLFFVAALVLLALGSFAAGRDVVPPLPYGPVPCERQLRWHEMEFYGFLHFTVNTFTDKEWGYGNEKETVFNPS